MSSFDSPRPGEYDPVREMHSQPESDIRFLQGGHHEHLTLTEMLNAAIDTLFRALMRVTGTAEAQNTKEDTR